MVNKRAGNGIDRVTGWGTVGPSFRRASPKATGRFDVLLLQYERLEIPGGFRSVAGPPTGVGIIIRPGEFERPLGVEIASPYPLAFYQFLI